MLHTIPVQTRRDKISRIESCELVDKERKPISPNGTPVGSIFCKLRNVIESGVLSVPSYMFPPFIVSPGHSLDLCLVNSANAKKNTRGRDNRMPCPKRVHIRVGDVSHLVGEERDDALWCKTDKP